MYQTKWRKALFKPTKVGKIMEMINNFICMHDVEQQTVSMAKQVHYFPSYGTYVG